MILVFAGTTEGRQVCEYLNQQEAEAIACTATEYGSQLLEQEGLDHIRVLSGRLTRQQMEELIRENHISTVVDATHPYADIVSKNIDLSCRRTGAFCLRILREDESLSDESVVYVGSAAEAADYLQGKAGNILVTTGSKELSEFTHLEDYRKRVFARVLSTEASVLAAVKLGFEGKNLICMQGPFSEEMNEALIRMTDAQFLVTKQSGKAGGFPEKVKAAEQTGARLVVIRRPEEMAAEGGNRPERIRKAAEGGSCPEEEPAEAGYRRISLPLKEALSCLEKAIRITPPERKIILAGIGMGGEGCMTKEVIEAIRAADILIGARRMAEAGQKAVSAEKPCLIEYEPSKIKSYLDRHPQYRRAVILLSGDSGFFSAARNLKQGFSDWKVEILPGISSVSYLAARSGVSWDDAQILSIHGRDGNVVEAVRTSRKVFLLTSGTCAVVRLCDKLNDYGLGHAKITAGLRLSYPDEKILTFSADEIPDLEKQPGEQKLVTLLIENDRPDLSVSAGLPDSAFERGTAGGKTVPMTKSEVRAVVLSRLRLRRDSIVYDIGAGTGSVSVECARLCPEGWVYAFERKPEAAELIRKNAKKLGTDNVNVIEGTVPDILMDGASPAGLKPPTHAFLGGTSGNMKAILKALLKRNPKVRVVITAVALETLSEAQKSLRELSFAETEVVCVNVARAEKTGPYSMMKGQNPVWILSAGGTA